MTKDEICKITKQADKEFDGDREASEWVEYFAKLVAAKEREACLDVIETHRIPVGNSAAGEMACEWTYEALKEIVAKIRARGEV